MKIIISSLVGTICITRDDGEKVYNQIYPSLKNGQRVTLDFSGVKFFTSSFFNTAIGRLFRDFSKGELDQLLEIENLNEAGRRVLDVVMENSERYYKDFSYKTAVDTVIKKLGEEED